MKNTVASFDLIQMLRSRARQSSQKQVAAELGISPQFLNDLLWGRKEITPRVAEVMGYRREVVFVKVRKPWMIQS